jgi:hypothetical protein
LDRHKYGFYYWTFRFAITVAFFAFFAAITGMQISTASLGNNVMNQVEQNQENNTDAEIEGLPTPEDIQRRYLFGWHGFIKFTIIVGLIQLLHDIIRLARDRKKYLW